MVYPIDRCEQDGIVAVLTHIAGQDVIEVFTDRVCAVVTTETITREIGGIEVCRQPGHRGVTIIAIVAALYVGGVLAGRNGTVMA